jgi:hypothetical protein
VTETVWWYERDGQQAGPVPLAALQQLATSGELKPAARVWTAGMATWARADTVPALSWPAPGVAPPPLSDTAPVEPPPADPFLPPAPATPPAAGSPPVQPSTMARAVEEPEEIGIASVILLSVVTLGIYGMIKFFQTGRAYERLAGRETRFQLYFWLFAGLLAAAVLLNASTGVLGFPLGLASIVFQFLALGEALRARRDGIQRWGLPVRPTSDQTHYLYLGLGVGLSFILVGLVFVILQAMKWFADWNLIRAAALRRG